MITRRWIRAALLLIGSAVILGTWFVWYRLLRDAGPTEITDDRRWFLYGSLGGEKEVGFPYWIWIVLPRVFPDLMPGPGGYRAFGVAWEQGEELPVGFTKRTVGFARIGNNCALCHAATYRLAKDQNPVVAVGAPANRFDPQALFRFLGAAARDPRFNSGRLLHEIDQNYELDWFDRLAYRFLIIPLTRKALIRQSRQLAWMNARGRPAWGPGRDDAFNLPKFVLAKMNDDNSAGQCDFGSVWNMRVRSGPGRYLNWGGESPSLRTVVVDSAVGLGSRPGREFEGHMARLQTVLSELKPSPWPYTTGVHSINRDRADKGKRVYDRNCAVCHEPGAARCNVVIPQSEVGTDPERLRVWSQEAANATNRAISGDLRAERPDVVKNDGYLSPPLDGIWLRAPYLHNGSVPTLRALLSPPAERPIVFYRGYDLYDPVNVGFISDGVDAEREGFRVDVRLRGNGNHGHLYGVDLEAAEKFALLEYLKTL